MRTLAEDLGINPNTVMKAYQELERNGYIYTLNKKGVFVAKDPETARQRNRKDAVSMITALKEEGFSREELLEVMNEIYESEEKTC